MAKDEMMRWIVCLMLLVVGSPLLGEDRPAGELEKLQAEEAEIRKAAAADPTVKDADSAPVKVYLTEQKRRRLMGLSSLRQRIAQAQGDQSKEALLPVWREQLAALESKPLDEVSFDSAYNYKPTTGLLGYSRKVRLLENTADGKSIIQVDNIALQVAGLGTSNYASGKFFSIDKAILIGPEIPDQTVKGVKRVVYQASLVDLDAVLKGGSGKTP
jgi:hypothetical protein